MFFLLNVQIFLRTANIVKRTLIFWGKKFEQFSEQMINQDINTVLWGETLFLLQ